jgi:osmotically-inducible protein OsmY
VISGQGGNTIAKPFAGPQVVANEVARASWGPKATPRRCTRTWIKVSKITFTLPWSRNKLEDNVKFDVKNGVVKLTGDVNSQALRSQAAQIASAVPNVQQVVNEVQVKNQRATSSN